MCVWGQAWTLKDEELGSDHPQARPPLTQTTALRHVPHTLKQAPPGTHPPPPNRVFVTLGCSSRPRPHRPPPPQGAAGVSPRWRRAETEGWNAGAGQSRGGAETATEP